MIKISKLADYAVVLLSVLSRAEGRLMSAHCLADETHIPEPTVAKVTKKMARAGLVSSVRGVRGGYKLSNTPCEISVLDIVEAIDGPVHLTECVVHDGVDECSLIASCPSIGRWDKVNAVINQALSNVSLNDMVRDDYKLEYFESKKEEAKVNA